MELSIFLYMQEILVIVLILTILSLILGGQPLIQQLGGSGGTHKELYYILITEQRGVVSLSMLDQTHTLIYTQVTEVKLKDLHELIRRMELAGAGIKILISSYATELPDKLNRMIKHPDISKHLVQRKCYIIDNDMYVLNHRVITRPDIDGDCLHLKIKVPTTDKPMRTINQIIDDIKTLQRKPQLDEKDGLTAIKLATELNKKDQKSAERIDKTKQDQAKTLKKINQTKHDHKAVIDADLADKVRDSMGSVLDHVKTTNRVLMAHHNGLKVLEKKLYQVGKQIQAGNSMLQEVKTKLNNDNYANKSGDPQAAISRLDGLLKEPQKCPICPVNVNNNEGGVNVVKG